jgi:hypothetical protein
MLLPQSGHLQVVSSGGDATLALSVVIDGRRVARQRLARKPKCLMRTKPRGRIWSGNRRRNSFAGSVMRRFFFWWAESRHWKVT